MFRKIIHRKIINENLKYHENVYGGKKILVVLGVSYRQFVYFMWLMFNH